MQSLAIAISTLMAVRVGADLHQECAKLYNPNNYLVHLPSLKLPYVGDVPVPYNVPAAISPSPTVKTKAIKVVTQYVYKNPVCIKYTKKRAMCKKDDGVRHKGNFEQLVTKEYFVRDRQNDVEVGSNRQRRAFGIREPGGWMDDYVSESYHTENDHAHQEDDYHEDDDPHIKSSEYPISLSKENRKTPNLSKKQVQDMLIEDRLDQLETILPHYTRRRTYQTSTITVTKVLSNRRATATMLVKNCIPYGYDFCEPKSRKSKVAGPTEDDDERHYFG